MNILTRIPDTEHNMNLFRNLRSKITRSVNRDLYNYELCMPYDVHIISCDPKNNRVYVCYAMLSDGMRGWCDFNQYLNQANMPKPMFCGATEMPATSVLHRHDYFEMMFVISGSVTQIIEGEKRRFEEGDVCILNCDVEHAEVFSTDFSCVYLCLRRDFLSRNLLGYVPPNSPLGQFFLNNIQEKSDYKKDYINFFSGQKHFAGEVEFLLNKIVEEHIWGRPGFQQMVNGLMIRLMSRLQDPLYFDCDHVKLDSSPEAYIFTKVTRLMEYSPRPLSRGELAEALCYNSDYINRVIKKKTGMSIVQYNRSIQMKKAEMLLSGTELSISEIISLLGYENRTYFYKLFSEKNKMTPQEYRSRFGPSALAALPEANGDGTE